MHQGLTQRLLQAAKDEGVNAQPQEGATAAICKLDTHAFARYKDHLRDLFARARGDAPPILLRLARAELREQLLRDRARALKYE